MALIRELLNLSNKYDTRVAFEEMNGVTKTYRELYEDVVCYGNYMSKDSHQRIAILGGTSYQWLCHAYGAIVAGKTVVVADPLLPIDDIVSLLTYTDVEEVFVDEEDKKLRAGIEEKGIVYRTYVQAQEELCDEHLQQDGDMIFFTSGTSGKAKGVVLPFAAEYENAKRFEKAVATGMDLKEDMKMYTPLPFYHIYATTMALVFLYKGKTICLGNPRRILQEIPYFKPAVFVMVSTMAEYLLKSGILDENAKLFAVAGAKCEKSLQIEAAKHGMMVQNFYGASETAGAIAASIPGQDVERMLPVDGVQVFSENGDEIAIATCGHMTEYYKNPEATQEVMQNGKIYLGDVGQFFEDGMFSPIGRKQDVIAMKNGNKLYCNELDEELSAIEGINDACVIYEDGKVIAVVVTTETDNDIVKKNIKAYNKKQPYFRKIDEIWFREESLPRTSIGKLKRKQVTEEYKSKNQEE